MPLITKGEYAALRKVSAARVAQYIATGHLDEALFHGDGNPAGRKDRYARIDVEKVGNPLQRAQRQVPFAALDTAHVRAVDAHVVGEGFLAVAAFQTVAAQIAPDDPLQLAFHNAQLRFRAAT